MRIPCANWECDFSGDTPLPIVAVDEPLYRRLPAFVVATVDKFASLPWVGESGALLGGADRHDESGFYGAAEPRRGNRLSQPLPPPDLVIQDELHLHVAAVFGGCASGSATGNGRWVSFCPTERKNGSGGPLSRNAAGATAVPGRRCWT